MKYLQGIAFLIILLYATMVDGIVEAVGLSGLAVVTIIVLTVTHFMIEAGAYD